jgi:anti-sigma factor RsiW
VTCIDVENLILDRIDGRLAPDLEPVVRDHLAACESCRVFLAAQTELDRVLLESPRPRLAPHFSSRVMARVDGDEARPRLGFAWELAGLGAVAAAAGFCVSFFFPMVVAGGPWIAAGAVLCGGVWLTLAEPPTPSA